MAATYGDVRHLLPNNYKNLITSWLEEDCPSLDYGGFVVGERDGEAAFTDRHPHESFLGCVQVPRSSWRDGERMHKGKAEHGGETVLPVTS